ncbi:calcium-binding protein, partial [Paraburkholderia sediminicola]|uniref:calcium-binding protein n=1 Tax=Paraburkholderia sediminicola TaxID=458836 RepID=UPI0038B7A55A
DYESGGGGGDTFVFNARYGHLEISELDFSGAPHNVLQLGTGIAESSLAVTTSSNGKSLVLTDGISGDQITLDNALTSNYYGVQQVRFADDTVWTEQQLIQMASPITGTTGADTLTGTAQGDVFDGKGGTDIEVGGGGNDTYLLEPNYGGLTIANGVASSNVANGTLSILNESPE